jgi:hypothetical protein
MKIYSIHSLYKKIEPIFRSYFVRQSYDYAIRLVLQSFTLSRNPWRRLVPRAGLEPAQALSPKDFKSFASTKFRHPGTPLLQYTGDFYFKLVCFTCLSYNLSYEALCQAGSSLEAMYGGGTRIRTGGQGFADPCLTTWLCRRLFLCRQRYAHFLSKFICHN